MADPAPAAGVPAWLTARYPGASITPVTAGWSEDRKYRITTATDSKLLRASPLAAYARKEAEFQQVTRINLLTDALPRALELGAVPEHNVCFVVYQWIEGEAAAESLPRLPAAEQYAHGRTAGQILRQIHALPQTKRVNSHAAIAQKVAVRRREMREHGLEFAGYETMVAYLDAHLDLLVDAPTAFLHDDFHLGNMLIDPSGRLRVIDLNRSNFGDPVEDLKRLFTVSRQLSVPFTRGQIHGYFNGALPPSFFAHVLCYVLIDCAFGLLWSRQFGQREIDFQNRLATQIMRDFDELRAAEPRWFATTE